MLHEEKRQLLFNHFPEARFDGHPISEHIWEEFDLYTIIPLCVCGTPQESATWLRDLMKLIQERSRSNSVTHLVPLGWETINAKIRQHWLSVCKEHDGPVTYLLLYFLDHLEWIEHGSNVEYAWITEKGRAALVALDEMVAYQEQAP